MLDLTAIEKAQNSLSDSPGALNDKHFIDKLTPQQFHTIRVGVILNFEITYELSWKLIKRRLENNIGNTEVDGASRRQLYRLAAESKLIEDIDLWMTSHKYRNLTSHTHDENTTKEVAGTFRVPASNLLPSLKAKMTNFANIHKDDLSYIIETLNKHPAPGGYQLFVFGSRSQETPC